MLGLLRNTQFYSKFSSPKKSFIKKIKKCLEEDNELAEAIKEVYYNPIKYGFKSRKDFIDKSWYVSNDFTLSSWLLFITGSPKLDMYSDLMDSKEVYNLLGIINLKILLISQGVINLELKLKDIIYNPVSKSFNVILEFFDPTKKYSVHDIPFWEISKKAKELQNTNLLTPLYGGFGSKYLTLSDANSYKSLNQNNTVYLETIDKIDCEHYDITIVHPEDNSIYYKLGYKMELSALDRIDSQNRNYNILSVTCKNFTTLSPSDLDKMKEEYSIFRNKQFHAFIEEEEEFITKFGNKIEVVRNPVFTKNSVEDDFEEDLEYQMI